jgi:alpha-galactosidase
MHYHDRVLKQLLLLQVGNSVEMASEGRARAHFALWAIVKAPLMIGADLRYLQKTDLDVYKAEEVIAVNQDALGIAGDLIFTHGSLQV